MQVLDLAGLQLAEVHPLAADLNLDAHELLEEGAVGGTYVAGPGVGSGDGGQAVDRSGIPCRTRGLSFTTRSLCGPKPIPSSLSSSLVFRVRRDFVLAPVNAPADNVEPAFDS